MKHYGLIGYPLGHSWSPAYFTAKFLNENIDAEYHLFPLEELSDFGKLLLENPRLSGLNVTIPHKTSIIPFLDELSKEAAAIGAVNTIQFASGKLIGHNTDAFGFEQTLLAFNLLTIRGALVLGTGGAAKAVHYVLQKYQIPHHFVSRNNPDTLPYSTINQSLVAEFNLIINTTPVGMYPNIEAMPPINPAIFGAQTLLIDLIYNPAQTVLMREAENRGAKAVNGLKMLQNQANRAWEIWEG